LRRCAGPWVRLRTVGDHFFRDFLEDDDLARGEFENERHEHALRFDIAGTAGGEVLFEEDAFMGDVLVDNPEAFAIDGYDEAGTHLAKRL